MRRILKISTIFVFYSFAISRGTVINVPADCPTIQAGIDSSFVGDTVLVQPGTYVENININGHNITLASLYLTSGDTSYISSTVIDGDSSGSVITLNSGVDSTAVICGFRIQNGYANEGGGIYCNNSSPIICHNIICGNSATGIPGYGGGGICCDNSSPLIYRNTICDNSAFGSFGYGGAILLWDECYPIIAGNSIKDNSAVNGGGGISFWNSDPILLNTVICGNSADSSGGGICILNHSNPRIINCTISDNEADESGGIHIYEYLPGWMTNTIVWNNLPPDTNNVGTWTSYCNIQGGCYGEGNIDIDPLFRDPLNDDYHLMSTACGDPYDSPCIDAGHPNFLDSLVDCSWGLGSIRSDMGAYAGGDSTLHTEWVINVPGDQPTIQDAIAVSRHGDTVLVHPGTYFENINFYGHNIVLGSLFLTTGDTSYISTTIIDGDSSGSVVKFENFEDSTTAIIGFTIQNGNTIFSNGGSGGGIYCFFNVYPLISHNIIKNNYADASGGGIYCQEALPAIRNNKIIDNLGNISGGGIYSISEWIGGPVIANNLIAGNTAYVMGGGILIFSDSIAIIANNTICFNTGTYQGGGIVGYDTNIVIVNTILWGNSYPTGPQIYGSPNVTYSDIEGGWAGEGNIDIDPLFRDPQGGDFHLQDSLECGDTLYSPCIDAGSPDILDSLLACNWGLGEARSDMGAYGGYILGCEYVTGDVNGTGNYNGLDITYGVNFFKGGSDPMCAPGSCPISPCDAFFYCGDVNGSCSYNGLDITYGVNYFKGGAGPIPCPDCPPMESPFNNIQINKKSSGK
ncbi:MAG: hypothetical protein JSU85_08320 [Candidatus Zixiibacteriota bacterium]|nr:MAG: hypothetical protein JSU85_08320 [candidate division Zixibacteria bacterium]